MSRLKAIQRRYGKVEKTGNWKARRDGFSGNYVLVTDNSWPDSPLHGIEGQIGEMYDKDEARFAASAKADIGWLLNEIERLKGNV
jgi:hypothetical protein